MPLPSFGQKHYLHLLDACSFFSVVFLLMIIVIAHISGIAQLTPLYCFPNHKGMAFLGIHNPLVSAHSSGTLVRHFPETLPIRGNIPTSVNDMPNVSAATQADALFWSPRAHILCIAGIEGMEALDVAFAEATARRIMLIDNLKVAPFSQSPSLSCKFTTLTIQRLSRCMPTIWHIFSTHIEMSLECNKSIKKGMACSWTWDLTTW